MPSLRDALEAALVENPDDLATHRAYADYLQEQGDPRGEFIQVQLALEEPERTTEERQELERRERELLDAHEREWLGILANELLGSEEAPWASWGVAERPYKSYDIHFGRGWIDHITLRKNAVQRGSDLGRLLCKAPESRLLRKLVLEYDPFVAEQLLRSPFLCNVRVFQIGDAEEDSFSRITGPAVRCAPLPTFVARLPSIEELYLMAWGYDAARIFSLPNLRHLRILQVDHLMAPYPLDSLADNSALGNLTHLLLRPQDSSEPLIDLAGVRAVLQSPHLRNLTHLQLRCSDLGDVGCTEIVTSGILKRLKVLDLRHGEITDAGARILADCADLCRLEHLDLDRNGLTQTGIDALRRVLGNKLQADNQQTAYELAQRQYLYEGDFE